MTGETKNVGAGKIFALPRDFLQESRTVIFKSVKSRKVRLEEKNGKAVAELRFDGFENLLLWRGGDAPFICIEPWHGADECVPVETLKDKKGIISLEAGKTFVFPITVEI
jgi:galactose mutarotase-like enzyme